MADLFSGASAQVTPFTFGAHAVRVIQRDGEPWFVAADVCAALNYKNTTQAVADNIDADERSICQIDRGGSLVLINESGLYALVLRSRKPEARKFAKWVTREVLPAIRKTGRYEAAEAKPLPSAFELARCRSMASAFVIGLQSFPARGLSADGAGAHLIHQYAQLAAQALAEQDRLIADHLAREECTA